MYPSRGNNAYGQQQQQQQSYGGQSAYGQNLGSDGGASQMSMSSRHAAMLAGHPSAGAHYGGQYTSVYGSMALSSALQAPGSSAKGSGPSGLDGRTGYGSTMQESPTDYSVVSQKYGQKGELSDYPPGDRRQYVERAGVYTVRDTQNEPTARFADSVDYGRHQHQGDIYDRLDAASALRKELLHAQALQSASIEGSSRQADYLAARAPATIRHAGQELLPYTSRIDPDPNTLSMISNLSHRAQHAPSILGAAPAPAPRRDVDDLVYAHSSANPGYGVSLPPGRDYGSRKGLHSTPLDSDYLARAWELDRRDEERRRELLRERDRERKRERERLREKERDRDRRERTPPRISRDRRESPHRRRSPVKEKRRDYVCKVYSSSLVEAERDYLSIDKRYPRLFTSPECSKVIVNWSRDNLKIPLNVPISFEHDFVQDDADTQHTEASTVTMVDNPLKSEHGSIQWNAKVILMSGLSRNAFEELSSERDYEDRIPHFCNMLRFGCLKNGSSLIAIGGLWEPFDGNDPSVDKSALVQTAIRHAKDLTGLDLKNCQHWNPFLEIHYDRVGKNGLFSHKEISVLYLPDLSDCLPSVDEWRDQWLAHKKAIAEREHLYALKREISREKKEGLKDKEVEQTKDVKKDVTPVKKKTSGPASKVNEKSKGKVKEPEKEGVESNAEIEKKVEGNNSEKKQVEEVAAVQKTGSGKKKIIRKVVKKKVVEKDNKPENAAQQSDGVDPKKLEESITATYTATNTNSEAASQNEKSTDNPPAVKTFSRKKVTKKVPVKKTVKKEDEGTQSEVAPAKEQEISENNPKKVPVKRTVKKEDEGTRSEMTPVKEEKISENEPKNADAGGASGKKTVKKKIIKKVMKRKVIAKNANNKDKVAEEAGITTGEQSATLVNQDSEVKLEVNESVSRLKSPNMVPELSKDGFRLDENENKNEKEEKKGKPDSGSLPKMKINNQNNQSKDEKFEEKVRKDKELKDKKMDEEIPRHPGFFLQTKGNKYSKLRSLSLSLDSLLGYDDNDIEESTFELSLFAETFNEMLQYQMGSRILTFLQKLRIKFVAKRNEKKRQLEETTDKEKVKTPAKRVKTDNSKVESKSVKTEKLEEAEPEAEKATAELENVVTENVENMKSEGDDDLDEDPEEDLEEDEDPDEDMNDASPEDDTVNEEKARVEKINIDIKSKRVAKDVKNEEGNAKETVSPNIKLEDTEKQEKSKMEITKKENIDKELLQAFRFFDRNRVGHIRVEDLRLIIHNLGNFLSHRDVKDLVQSALLESNTGRDDRILYNKLVRMDI